MTVFNHSLLDKNNVNFQQHDTAKIDLLYVETHLFSFFLSFLFVCKTRNQFPLSHSRLLDLLVLLLFINLVIIGTSC